MILASSCRQSGPRLSQRPCPKNRSKLSAQPVSQPRLRRKFQHDEILLFWTSRVDLIAAPIGRAGQPVECATAFVFLASTDSSYFTAQVRVSLLNLKVYDR